MAFRKSASRLVIEKIKVVASVPQRRWIAQLASLGEPEFWEYQNSQLLLRYQDAAANVPYFRKNRDLYPTSLEDRGNPLDTLSQLPLLSKSVVKAETEEFWRDPPLFGTGEHTTGGTTGAPLRVRAGVLDRGIWTAIVEDRYQRLVGTRSPRILRLSGYLDRSTGKDSIFVRIPGTKFAYLSIYSLTRENRGRIAEVIQAFQPQVIHGYASALHQLALLFSQAPFPELGAPMVVVSTSETLMPDQREEIERFVRTRVYNEYGSQEGQHLVLECEERSMHIHPARGIVEILHPDEDRPAAVGQLGRVVVTGLANRSMPLFRYDLGDSAVSTGFASDCKCGSRWPTIGTVYGRMEDLVRMRDGRRIGLLSHSTLKDVQGIRESQIVQTGFERFTYRIVPQEPDSFDRLGMEALVLSQLRNRLQTDVSVAFEYVDHIPRTESGKLRAVVVDTQDWE